MKSFVIIALISVSLCGFITQEEVDVLRTFAPFEVYDADENPLRTTPRNRSETSSKSN